MRKKIMQAASDTFIFEVFKDKRNYVTELRMMWCDGNQPPGDSRQFTTKKAAIEHVQTSLVAFKQLLAVAGNKQPPAVNEEYFDDDDFG